MGIDVIQGAWRYSGSAQRQRHRASDTFTRPIGIERSTLTCDFRQHAGPAGFRVLTIFNH
jgi:hypothetical protein